MKILIFDPAYQGLRNAFRGTLTIVLSFLILSPLASHWGQPPTLAFIGVLIAMMSSMVINDPTLRGQKITLLLLIFPSVLGLSASIVLSAEPPWRLGFFFGITFLVVCLRRFGPRASALGFILFMSYFAPLFFPLHLEALPWVIGAVVLSLALTFLMRFVIFPDRPEKILRLYLKGFGMHLDSVMHDLAEGLRHPDRDDFPRKIRTTLNRLTELSLLIEQFLNTTTSHTLRSRAESLQMSLFERELNLRRLLETAAVVLSGPESERPSRPAMAQWVDRVLDGKELPPPLDAPPSVREMMLALEALAQDRRQPLADPSTFAQVVQEIHEEKKVTMVAKLRASSGLHLSTKQAIQATLATALASFLGSELSPQRWYWASLTAFVVFAGASRGDTLTRAFLRVIGTIAGLVMGFLIAYALAGHPRFEWSAVILFIFLGIWGARFAFGFFSALAFTLMMSVLFDLMGQLTSQILFLRLEETAIGAVVGALISAVVLPTSTRSTIREAMAKYFRTLGDIVQNLPLEKSDLSARKNLISGLRNMDRDLMAVRNSALPLVQRLSFLRRGETPAALHDLSTLAHYVRHLATSPSLIDEELPKNREDCRALAQEFRGQAQKLELPSTWTPGAKEPVTIGPISSHFVLRCHQVLGEFSRRQL